MPLDKTFHCSASTPLNHVFKENPNQSCLTSICPSKAAILLHKNLWKATDTVSSRWLLPTYHHPRSSRHPGGPGPASSIVPHQLLHKHSWSPLPTIIQVWESSKWSESVKQFWWKKLSNSKWNGSLKELAATKSWVLTFNTTAGFSLNRHQLT